MERQYHYRSFNVAVEVLPENVPNHLDELVRFRSKRDVRYTAVVTMTKPLISGVWSSRFHLDDVCDAPITQESAAFWASYIAATKIIDDALRVFSGSVEVLEPPVRLGGLSTRS